MKTAPQVESRERLAEPYRFSREDYEAMISAGILDENDRVELIAGEILNKMPIGPTHASTVNRLNRLFSACAGESAIVSVQNPVALDAFSEPEPDIALLAPRSDLYANSHPAPADVYLIVEVADSSLRFDRERKIPLYASAGIPEVWLVDLFDKSVTRYRKPVQGSYTDMTRYAAGECIPIPRLANAQLALSDLAF